MRHDGTITIAVGMSANSRVWKNKQMLFSEFAARLAEEHKTMETHREFIAASKQEQGKIKDVGGYVGGYLRNGKRSPQNVVHRQLLTLDIDFAHIDFWDDFTMLFDNAAILHATHKHCEADPRYRLVMPLSREASPDEYQAVARKVAGTMGIDLFDNTTFETNRLMFWPSTPKDIDYYYRLQDGPWLDVDTVLGEYIDWRDTSLWPTADKTIRQIGENAKKQQDPKSKKGIIGAFCRTYGIAAAIEKFLPTVYVPSTDGRYTYTKGTTASGLVIYDDEFAFSHHGTDPCGGKLNNAFDLVRIQLFSHLDANEDPITVTKTKSYKAMEELARGDAEVKKTIASENLASVRYDFTKGGDEQQDYDNDVDTEQAVNWMSELEADAKGNYLSSANNINLILANDARLRGIFRHNDFDGRRYVFASLPWRRISRPEPVKNVDYSGVRNYIESIYGISGTLKIDDALALEFERNTYHPIKDYLQGLQWDGQPRIDALMVDFFGAEDNVYTREAIRKALVGSVARIYKPGCKFDLALTLVGPQGTKKSTFIKKLGQSWYSDTFMTVSGKEALEQIQGAWIIEIPELAGFRKAEVETVKHFMSKQEDTFRPAYARTSETFKRQCTFWPTTNQEDFLKDPTGNRRFNPIKVRAEYITRDVTTELEAEVDQIWAEAVHLYKNGEVLMLSREAELIATSEQNRHSEVDERRGLIEKFLSMKLPENWDKLDLFQRRMWLDDTETKGTEHRDYVCTLELWCECLGREKKDATKYLTRDLNDIMRNMHGWEAANSTKSFPIYGVQKYYIRKLD